jgi:hypothetical protein
MPVESTQHRLSIVTPRGRQVPWTDEDRLWLLRAVEAEGEPHVLVAQTLVNRFAWMFDEQPARFLTLTDLVRSYAQPVNPRWFPDGGAFKASLQKLPSNTHAAALERAEKRRDVHSTRSTFSQSTIDAVRAALFGPVQIPEGALNFAAPSQAAPYPVLVPSTDPATNVIYGENGRGARARYSLTRASVGISPATRKAVTIVALLSFGLGAALLGGLYTKS